MNRREVTAQRVVRVLQGLCKRAVAAFFTNYKGSLFQVITNVIALLHVGIFCKSLISHALLKGPERSKSLGPILKWHLWLVMVLWLGDCGPPSLQSNSHTQSFLPYLLWRYCANVQLLVFLCCVPGRTGLPSSKTAVAAEDAVLYRNQHLSQL